MKTHKGLRRGKSVNQYGSPAETAEGTVSVDKRNGGRCAQSRSVSIVETRVERRERQTDSPWSPREWDCEGSSGWSRREARVANTASWQLR